MILRCVKARLSWRTIGSFTGVIAYDVDTDSTVGANGGYSYIHAQDPVAGNISLAVSSLGESFHFVEEHKVSIFTHILNQELI